MLFTKLQLFQNIGVAVGGSLGLLLLQTTELAWAPWLLFSVLTAGMAVYAWCGMTADSSERREVEIPRIGRAVAQVWASVTNQRNLAIYLLGWSLQYGFWGVLAYFWVPLLIGRMDLAGVSGWQWMAGAWLVWCLARVVASVIAVRIADRSRHRVRWVIAFSSVATIIPIVGYLALAPLLSPMLSAACFFIAVLVSKVFEVAMTGLRMSRLNLNIEDSDLRATYISAGFAAGAVLTLVQVVAVAGFLGGLPSSPAAVLWMLAWMSLPALAGAIVYNRQADRSA